MMPMSIMVRVVLKASNSDGSYDANGPDASYGANGYNCLKNSYRPGRSSITLMLVMAHVVLLALVPPLALTVLMKTVARMIRTAPIALIPLMLPMALLIQITLSALMALMAPRAPMVDTVLVVSMSVMATHGFPKAPMALMELMGQLVFPLCEARAPGLCVSETLGFRGFTTPIPLALYILEAIGSVGAMGHSRAVIEATRAN